MANCTILNGWVYKNKWTSVINTITTVGVNSVGLFKLKPGCHGNFIDVYSHDIATKFWLKLAMGW